MSGSSRIAQLLKISPNEAMTYCEEVRSLSGLGTRLHYKVIAKYLAQNISQSPSPQKMVELIKTTKLNVPTKNQKKRPVLIQAKSRRWNIEKASKRAKRYQTDRFSKPIAPPSYVVRSSFLDSERVSNEKLDHCPHGVPKIKVCAICDPEKFREMNGFD